MVHTDFGPPVSTYKEESADDPVSTRFFAFLSLGREFNVFNIIFQPFVYFLSSIPEQYCAREMARCDPRSTQPATGHCIHLCLSVRKCALDIESPSLNSGWALQIAGNKSLGTNLWE